MSIEEEYLYEEWQEEKAARESAEELLDQAKALADKFMLKVHNGRARSKETYAECLALSTAIERYHQGRKL
jgi:hypothetical protein